MEIGGGALRRTMKELKKGVFQVFLATPSIRGCSLSGNVVDSRLKEKKIKQNTIFIFLESVLISNTRGGI